MHAHTRAALRTETARATACSSFCLGLDFARDCPSRCIHANCLAHTPPAYGACGAERAACLTANQMPTRKKQYLERVCVTNLTDHRFPLRSGWISLSRHSRSFLGRLLPRSGSFARSLCIASAHVLLEVAEVGAGVGLLACPDRIPSNQNVLPPPLSNGAHMPHTSPPHVTRARICRHVPLM